MSKPHDNTRHVRDLSKFLLAIHGTSPGPYRVEFTLDKFGQVKDFSLARIESKPVTNEPT